VKLASADKTANYFIQYFFSIDYLYNSWSSFIIYPWVFTVNSPIVESVWAIIFWGHPLSINNKAELYLIMDSLGGRH